MFGKKKGLERKLSEQGGTVAWATVVDTGGRWTSGTNNENGPWTVGNKNHMEVTLMVEPDDEPAFEATFRQVFSGKIPIEGFQAKVIYDPNDHSKIAVLEDQIFPPGISHEQAERSAEHQRQRKAAEKSGKLAEFLQEDIRKAQATSGNPAVLIDGTRAQGGRGGVAAAGAPSNAAAKPDIADELKKLADLRDRGVLSEAEFEVQKAKLLATS